MRHRRRWGGSRLGTTLLAVAAVATGVVVPVVAAAPAAAVAASAGEWDFVDLGHGWANGINNNGQVTFVKIVTVPSNSGGPSSDYWVGQVWQDGVFRTLGGPDGSPNDGRTSFGLPGDINDDGVVVGTTGDGRYGHPARWTWAGATGAPVDTGVFPNVNNYGVGVGVDAAGDVLGWSAIDGTGSRPFVSAGGTGPLQKLDHASFGANNDVYPCGMADDGTVMLRGGAAGYVLMSGPGATPVPLGLTSAPYCGNNSIGLAHPIASDGTVVGRTSSPDALVVRDPSGTVASYPGSPLTAVAVNSQGVVAGWYLDQFSRAAVLRDGKIIDLSGLFPAGSSGGQALDINDRGDIVGQFTAADGLLHGFVLTTGFGLDVRAYDQDGVELDGDIAPGTDITVEVTVTNPLAQAITGLTFTGGSPLVLDPRSTGTVGFLDAPDDPGAFDLAAGAKRTFSYRLTATRDGIDALTSKVTGTSQGGTELTAGRSVKLVVVDGDKLTKALRKYASVKVISELMQHQYQVYAQAMRQRALDFEQALRKRLSPSEEKAWFGNTGSKAGLVVTNTDRATGLQTQLPAEAVAVHLPRSTYKGYTAEELQDAYNSAFMAEVENGVKKYVKHWGDVAQVAKKGLKDSYYESVMTLAWIHGTATPEQREVAASLWWTFALENARSAKNGYEAVSNEVTQLGNDGAAAWYAVTHSFEQVDQYYEAFRGIVKKEDDFHADLLKIADDNPVRFQQEWAKRDAEIFNKGWPVIADTLAGGGAGKVVEIGASSTRVKATASALFEMAEESGILTRKGAVSTGVSKIPSVASAEGTGVPAALTPELGTQQSMLQAEGRLVVESKDFGNVYEMPNLGGVPERTLDSKAKILGELEKDYQAATGKPLELAEVLKTSSPLRKEGDVAKLELTAGKSGKAAMVDGGMPEAALGEANYWHSPTSPDQLPGWKTLPKVRQEAAIAEWKKANERWEAWVNPAPGSKEAKLREVVGQRATVPLDDAPIAGIQRFVNAEFEVVRVTRGSAECDLVRVKHYEIQVKDVNTGKITNTKVVVNNLDVAAPQTADADAVAIGKVVGRTADGEPIIQPLSRAEKEFVIPRYIDKNVKARRTGVQPDLAEHGATLNMFDASARSAGKLIPTYGAVFMPRAVAEPFLARIAPFVKPAGYTNEQMVEKMLKFVEAEGGFGQHAVTVTRDGRWLGDVKFKDW